MLTSIKRTYMNKVVVDREINYKRRNMLLVTILHSHSMEQRMYKVRHTNINMSLHYGFTIHCVFKKNEEKNMNLQTKILNHMLLRQNSSQMYRLQWRNW